MGATLFLATSMGLTEMNVGGDEALAWLPELRVRASLAVGRGGSTIDASALELFIRGVRDFHRLEAIHVHANEAGRAERRV